MPPAPAASSAGFRPEIQALRAFAVLAVVLYHLWPGRLPGGYVGVDIFFAISGFLIIGHLLREAEGSGRISLVAFWGRRARRLLPASLVVIVATAIATLALVPQVEWRQWFQEMAASAGYVQNWLLAANSVDYLGVDNRPSPTQHFWSLSVEEQFYIAWPLIIIGVLAISRRMPRISSRRVVGLALAIVTVVSFALSVRGVATEPAPAYFVTQSRAWEFGAGGLLALLATVPLVGRDVLRAIVSWLGIGALVVTVLVFTADTPFPGVAALLPVVGTLAVIWAGVPAVRWAPSALLSVRPVQWVGGISYSFYLWHWAPIVILPIVLDHELGWIWRVAILVGSAVLAWLTKRFVEDPVRTRGPLVRGPAWRSVLGAVVASALIVTACVAVTVRTEQSAQAAAAIADAAIQGDNECVGEYAMLPGAPCTDIHVATELTDPLAASLDLGRGVQVVDQCKQSLESTKLLTCEIGDTKKPITTIALIGDSHAGHWLEPLDIYGKAHGIKFVTMLKTWCAGTVSAGKPAGAGTEQTKKTCLEWGDAVIDRVVGDPEIDGALFSSFVQAAVTPTKDTGAVRLSAKDYLASWDPILDAGKFVMAIRDTPNTDLVQVPYCISQHFTDVDPCAVKRADALLPEADDPVLQAAAERPRVTVIDLTDAFCDETTCHALIGGLIVYFDDHHMTATFARTMATTVGSKILAALP